MHDARTPLADGDGTAGYSHRVDDRLLPHLSPLGWEHINLTGHYLWQRSTQFARGTFRPFKPSDGAWRTILSVS